MNLYTLYVLAGLLALLVIVIVNQRRYRKKKLPRQLSTAMVEPGFSEDIDVDVESEMVHVNALPERVSADPQFTAMGKLLVVYCVSEPGRPYVGYELLQALLSAGLRFGENNVFHRYTGTNNRGTILFSFASAHEPGTFDIQKMGSVVCRGLCCFMQLTNEEHNIDALDGLLTTAYQLTQDLGGALLDGDRNPFDSECYDQYRYQIARFQQERQIP